MVLGEAYIKDILRPPPVSHVPDNVAHPYQKSLYTYFTKKVIPKHWFLAAGFAFTLTLYGALDNLRDAGKKNAYDAAVLQGKQPCKCSCNFLSWQPPRQFVHRVKQGYGRDRYLGCRDHHSL